jgi:hypothetical protein
MEDWGREEVGGSGGKRVREGVGRTGGRKR